MKQLLLLIFSLLSLPIYSQLKITDLSYNIDGLQLVDVFYKEHIDSIDLYKDKEISLIDFIMYADALGEGEPFCYIDNTYVLNKQYTFIDNEYKESLIYYKRDIKSPKRFIPMSVKEVNALISIGHFKYIFMPCKFKIIINSEGQQKKVIFERISKTDYLIIDFGSKIMMERRVLKTP